MPGATKTTSDNERVRGKLLMAGTILGTLVVGGAIMSRSEPELEWQVVVGSQPRSDSTWEDGWEMHAGPRGRSWSRPGPALVRREQIYTLKGDFNSIVSGIRKEAYDRGGISNGNAGFTHGDDWSIFARRGDGSEMFAEAKPGIVTVYVTNSHPVGILGSGWRWIRNRLP